MTEINNPAGPAPLTYGAVADAYGFCFEFASLPFVGQFNDLHYHRHPEIPASPGVYSDDTQMHLAIAEVIASEIEWTAKNLADSFVQVFKRDPRVGYAKGFHALLEEIGSGQELLDRIRPNSERNGAAMRAPIIGLYSNIDQVIDRSSIQARITHDTKIGVDSAVAASLMSHFFAFELGTKDSLPAFLDKYVPGYNWGVDWSAPVKCHGEQTIRAALSAIRRHDSLSDVLKECVAFTGDVDSVAIVAIASASNSNAFKRDIPQTLWTNCERSEYGLSYLLALDQKVRAVTMETRKSEVDGSA